MKREISPVTAIGVIILVVIIVGIVGWYLLGRGKPEPKLPPGVIPPGKREAPLPSPPPGTKPPTPPSGQAR